MRCERYRKLFRRAAWLRPFLIWKHFAYCAECRRVMEAGLNNLPFFQAEDFKGADLWPAVRAGIGAEKRDRAIAKPAKTSGPGGRLFSRPVPAFLPAFVLSMAVLAAVSYLGFKNLRTGAEVAAHRTAVPAPSGTDRIAARPRASISRACISGRKAKVFIYVEPKNLKVSLFWIEPAND